MRMLYYERNNSYTIDTPIICHYGVKGMKWGVRRTKEELKYNPSSIFASINRKKMRIILDAGEVTCFVSEHAGFRVAGRRVSARDISDALTNPLKIKERKYNDYGLPSQQVIGKNATVAINPETGCITTLWPTGSKLRDKYLKG